MGCVRTAMRNAIAVRADNCLASSDFLATAISNTVRVPLYKRNSRVSHVHMLRQSGSRIAVVNVDQVDELAGLESEIGSLEHILVRDDALSASRRGNASTCSNIWAM